MHRVPRAPELQSSIPLSRHVYTPAARLQHSIPPYFRIATRAAALHTFVLPHRYACSMPPALHTSIPSYLHVATPTSSLQSSVPPLCHTYGTLPELHIPKLPRLHACSEPLKLRDLHTSMSVCLQDASNIPPCLHVDTFAAQLQTSKALYLDTSPSARLSERPALHTSTSLRVQHASSTPSIPPRRYACTHLRPTYFDSSMSLRVQGNSRPPDLHTSMLPRLNACSAPPALHTSIPSRRCACRPPPDLQSVPPRLHVATRSARL